MISIEPNSSTPTPAPRPRRTVLGAALRSLVWGLVVALMAVVGTLAWESGRNVAPRRPATSKLPGPTAPPTAAPTVAPVDPDASPLEPESPSDRSGLRARLERIEESVVKIETGQAEQLDTLGSGFVVDRRGLVATSYHVVAEATQARVRFKDGAAYDVEGYAAVDPQTDLAVLKLRDPPQQLPTLELIELDPDRLSSVVAIGHPRGVEYSVFEGKVSRVVTTSELPGGSQRFLRQLIEGRVDHRWIQHTAGLSEGNSGGPLLNQQGQVVGINTWVDRAAQFSYALHARHLRQMLENLPPTVAPLAQFARRDARTLELLKQLTPESLDALVARAQGFGWRPETEADYEVLQRLAWSITAIQLPGTLSRGRLDDRLDALTITCDRIVKRLAESTWDALGQVTIVNEHASAHVFEPMAGLFLFATVERVVDGDEGERGAIVQIAGEEQRLFLPLDRELSVPDAGLQCLVLGVNYDGHTVRYGDNPLRLITAPVIATRTILPLKTR